MQWVYLLLAIISEIIATLSLRASVGFTKTIWLFPIAIGYGLALYLMSVSLKLGMPVGVAYAVWSAVGIVCVALAAKVIWNDPLTAKMMLGFALIIVGVAFVQLGTKHT
ncbi:MAG: multidrug efflux SMR transporter [bacterium]